MEYKQKLEALLLIAAQQGASDLHISVGRKPILRIDGVLLPLEKEQVLTPEVSQGLALSMLTPEQLKVFTTNKQVDFSYAFQDKARFRVNVYKQRGYISAALRLISAQIKTIEELRLPPIFHDLAKVNQGFVLVVGPAGEGKSTTLASMLDEINHTRTEHLITIEDPIEYLFVQDKSIISQREIGLDTDSFPMALRSILRQDPDVIMIGEMRDRESIGMAITAAETGHLVFSTLHTNSASQTIDRIIDSFPSDQQTQVTSQLASTIVAIVSQRLVPKVDGGRVPALEIMIANSAIKNLIRERKTYQIDLVIETSIQEGMMSMNRSLANLISRKEVSLQQAEAVSLNPSELRILLERR